MFIDPFDFWIEGRVYDELQVAAAQEKTTGGLLLTEACKEKPSIGTVIILSFGHISFQNHITETSYIFCLHFPIKEYLVLTGYVVITLGHDTGKFLHNPAFLIKQKISSTLCILPK